MNLQTILILILIGLAAGVVSGLVGVGGGILMVPAMVFFLGLSQHAAQGTSLAVMLPPVGILACINYYKAGALDWKFALIIAITFVVGGYFGSKMAIAIDQRMLRKIFGVMMLLAALKLIFGK
ncbi:sulfite exporter TauE/SafE family protein [Cryomorphaceae bacterium]|nr:sulfite exporter TauE/SafE family protein [Cryomorphaceae bacterium]